jgi:hypothetical protein
MTRPEVITNAITKQLSWVQATEILEISARTSPMPIHPSCIFLPESIC